MDTLHSLTVGFNIKSAHKVGVTDEITECFCCGKTNLKRTVVLRDLDGQYSFYGSSCAKLAGKQGIKGKISEAKKTFEVIEEQLGRDSYRLVVEGEMNHLTLLLLNPHTQKWIERHSPKAELINLSEFTDSPLVQKLQAFYS